jgi:hypothetical protein
LVTECDVVKVTSSNSLYLEFLYGRNKENSIFYHIPSRRAFPADQSAMGLRMGPGVGRNVPTQVGILAVKIGAGEKVGTQLPEILPE